MAGHGWVWRGKARLGRAGPGMARLGKAWAPMEHNDIYKWATSERHVTHGLDARSGWR